MGVGGENEDWPKMICMIQLDIDSKLPSCTAWWGVTVTDCAIGDMAP